MHRPSPHEADEDGFGRQRREDEHGYRTQTGGEDDKVPSPSGFDNRDHIHRRSIIQIDCISSEHALGMVELVKGFDILDGGEQYVPGDTEDDG